MSDLLWVTYMVYTLLPCIMVKLTGDGCPSKVSGREVHLVSISSSGCHVCLGIRQLRLRVPQWLPVGYNYCHQSLPGLSPGSRLESISFPLPLNHA